MSNFYILFFGTVAGAIISRHPATGANQNITLLVNQTGAVKVHLFLTAILTRVGNGFSLK